jgi:hypothetical protein
VINARAKDAFWQTVEDCLVEMHGLARPEAHERSWRLRNRLESPPSGVSPDLVYHDEPYDVAYDLAGYEAAPGDQARTRAADLDRYQAILRRHNW